MAMTRKDFELIASALADTQPRAQGLTPADFELVKQERHLLAVTLAAKLRTVNPRFDAGRFITACSAV